MGCQVSFTWLGMDGWLGSLALRRSMFSLRLILSIHRVAISFSVWVHPEMTRSQRITQIRWADSDIVIRSSLARAHSVAACFGFVDTGGEIDPAPSICPRFGGCHVGWAVGQVQLAMSHTVRCSGLGQDSSICSRSLIGALQ